ncbi:MAG: hypothetical protein KGL39_34485 [Patescibacteria group bacterium]|nr:hypothetical protein [Patescibacteria group bacterium]
MALSVVTGGHASGGPSGTDPTSGAPNPNGYLKRTSLINHSAPSFGKQSFSQVSKVKTTAGKLGQQSRLQQSVSSLRRKGALA